MNKTIYRIMLCLSVCALLLIVFIGCKEQSGTKNDPVVTTEKVYEYEYQKLMEENGYTLVENAVKLNGGERTRSYMEGSDYKSRYESKAKGYLEYDPYLIVGEKVKSETYKKDLGWFSCRCDAWRSDKFVQEHGHDYAPHSVRCAYTLTVTTVRIEEIIEKYSSDTKSLKEGDLVFFVDTAVYADPADTVLDGGEYYQAASDYYRRYDPPYSGVYSYGAYGIDIPDGKSVFYFHNINENGYVFLSSGCLDDFIDLGDDNIAQYSWEFISLEENIMSGQNVDRYYHESNNGPNRWINYTHPFILQAQADYPVNKEGE